MMFPVNMDKYGRVSVPETEGDATKKAHVAGHEAGHIVGGLLRGVRVAGAEASEYRGETRMTKTTDEERIFFGLCGMAADGILVGELRRDGSQGDLKTVRDLAGGLGMSAQDVEEALLDARDELAPHSRALAEFARALTEHDSLSEQDIQNIGRAYGLVAETVRG